jgi:peptidoglycan/xylan/chitin deacetylase (PgdA/CDA1 family)
MTNPLTVALKGKGYTGFVKRTRSLSERYGLTAAKMDRALGLFASLLRTYNCGASFAITASALARSGSIVEKYRAQNIEFAIHGLFHVDYSGLSPQEQIEHLARARQIFEDVGVNLAGFRAPYLRWNQDSLKAIGISGLSYDSSQALYWNVVGAAATDDYRRVLSFYRAASADDYPALPKLTDGVVQIPYCVPDDESLIERLKLEDAQSGTDIWLSILERSYALGELFSLGLHPERIELLQKPLAAVLARARSLSPAVWIARLDEIANWWRARREATFELECIGNDMWRLSAQGPPGTSILVRNLEVEASAKPAYEGFERVLASSFRCRAVKRPCIGLSPGSHPAMADFLRQQGYYVETGDASGDYSIYLHETEFSPEAERPLLKRLDSSHAPLIRFGRWPNGARSALCITGDIDALTLWDYGLRLIGR